MMHSDDKEITINKLQEMLDTFTARSEELKSMIDRLNAMPENYPDFDLPKHIAQIEGQLNFYLDKIAKIREVIVLVDCHY